MGQKMFLFVPGLKGRLGSLQELPRHGRSFNDSQEEREAEMP